MKYNHLAGLFALALAAAFSPLAALAAAPATVPSYTEEATGNIKAGIGVSLLEGDITITGGDASAANQTTLNGYIGATNATVCATDTGTCSLNALIKKINQGLTAIAAGQTAATQKTQVVDGSGNVIASTSNNLNVQCANCSGSGVSAADEATFTAGTSLFAAGGGFYQTTATSNALTNGQQGMFQATSNRALFTNLRNAAGTEVGTSTTPLQVTLANTGANATAVAVSAGSLPLPALAATSTKQSDGSQKTQIVDGSGNVIASTSNNLNVQCANCSGSGVSAADEASFTAGTSVFAASGGFYQTTATSNALTNGQQGMAQMTANRAVFANLRNASGTELAVALDATVGTTNTDIGPPGATACATDTGSCSLNALLQRLAQRLTTTIASLNSPFQSGGSIGNTSFASTVADGGNVVLGSKADAKSTATDTTSITMMQVLKQISASAQAPPSQAVTNAGTFATQSAITAASGSIASGAVASGAVASGAYASGSIADGAMVTLGAKADAKSTATDTTSITMMQVMKQISASVQAPPSQAVTNAGTFAVQNTQGDASQANAIRGAITSAMTSTTSTSLVAAPGGGLYNYILSISCVNSHATVGTNVIIQDGSGGTTLLNLAAGSAFGGTARVFPFPGMKQPTSNTALYAADVTTGASVTCDATGYKGS